MKFPYFAEARGAETRWTPYIPVTLHGSAGSLVLDALVDSGSEQNVFSMEVAKELGVPIATERVVHLQGIGGAATGRLTVVEIQLGRYRWTAPAIFTDAIGNRGVLGQAGFFAFFTVIFRHARHEVEVQHARNVKK
jgi:hypothetical protein